MSTNDHAAIRQTALDYIEGFYDGDVVRMERSLHPELAKRIAHPDAASGRSHLAEMSALALTQFTRDKASRPTPAAERQQDVDRARRVRERRQRQGDRSVVDRLPASLPLQRPLGDRERLVGDEACPALRRLLVGGCTSR
jgi:Putative lumazine-binding